MKRHLIFLLFFILLGITNSCDESCSERSEIIQTFLDIPELDYVFYPELEGRVPLYILDNEYIDKDIELYKYGEEVVIVDDTTGTRGNFIRIAKFDVEQDEIDIAFYYKIQNMEVEGTISREGGKCTVKNYEFIVF